MCKISKIKTTIFVCAIILLGIVFEDKLIELKYSIYNLYSSEYETQKSIVEPYFDEKFYLSKYADAVNKSGLKPIDHFLKKGWHSRDWRNHTDPNPWFNTTLYKDRLWGKKETLWKISDNPFVDFLKQPSITLSKHFKTVDIYANSNELTRAWQAVEGFMRLSKNHEGRKLHQYNINLHLPNGIDSKELIRFDPQIKRGLKVINDNYTNKSFYGSDFIKNPREYDIPEVVHHSQAVLEAPITYVKNDHEYLMHRLYNYTGWYKTGRINPMMINIAHNSDEPLVYTRFGDDILRFRKFLNNLLHANWKDKWRYPRLTPQDFKDYMIRISDGFDLCLISTKLPIKNLKVLPGYLYSCINESELDKTKNFEVSYLLSLGGGSYWFHRRWLGVNYTLRKDIWDHEKDITIPTKFFVSYRDREKFPKDMQARVMPTDSKKWIYNSEFSIVVENVMQEDWLSEKLLGCFMVLSVPIYIGCPNVQDYFDTRGMIVVSTMQELITATNSLTNETYQKMLPYLIENKKRAVKLINLEKDTIAEFFKSKVG